MPIDPTSPQARLMTLQVMLVPNTTEGPFPDFIPLEVEKAIRAVEGVISIRQLALVNVPDPRPKGRPKAGPDFY